MTNTNRICAGIVTFNPSLNRLRQVVRSIIEQVEELVIADNGSCNISDIKDVVLPLGDKVKLLLNTDNLGIAKALNQICKYSSQEGYCWVLTLDQDTICPPNLIQGLSRGFLIDNAGIICPAVKYEGVKLITENLSEEMEDDTACMTSSSLTRLSAWDAVGGFNEGYFIDFVDNEFCMKLRLHDLRIIRINSCIISHQLGDSVKRRFLWKNVKGTSHKPWRIYYMVRNNLLFIKEFKSDLNITKEYLKILYILGNEFFFSNQKTEVLTYAWKGFCDAMHNKTGKM